MNKTYRIKQAIDEICARTMLDPDQLAVGHLTDDEREELEELIGHLTEESFSSAVNVAQQ